MVQRAENDYPARSRSSRDVLRRIREIEEKVGQGSVRNELLRRTARMATAEKTRAARTVIVLGQIATRDSDMGEMASFLSTNAGRDETQL
jgi:hypothetical protein